MFHHLGRETASGADDGQLPRQVHQDYKKETGNALEGDEALELTAANYGRDEWWLLLESCDTP